MKKLILERIKNKIAIPKFIKTIFFVALSVILLVSCENNQPISLSVITSFNPIGNFKTEDGDIVELNMDLKNAIHTGISIPSLSESSNSEYFTSKISLTNSLKKDESFRYMVYYQNESYKDLESDTNIFGKVIYNSLAGKNFYGCWDGVQNSFKKTPLVESGDDFLITEKVKILGNPRNEKKYFGPKTSQNNPTKEQIEGVVKMIQNNENWYKAIVSKAKVNTFTARKQLFLDALWTIQSDRKKQSGEENHRWKRNPRVGNYSFLLVVLTEDAYRKLPYYIKNIELQDSVSGTFINPYYYFLHDENRATEDVWVKKSEKSVKTKVKYNLNKGVYVDILEYQDENIDESNFNKYCGAQKDLYEHAQFKQHFQSFIKNYRLHNIPIAKDVVSEYSLEEFKKNKAYYEKDSTDLLTDYARTTDCPCLTVGFDTLKKALTVVTPGNTEKPYRKENVGLKARIGFTYGKYTAAIKFPKLLSEENVWNGLTAAFWLIFQSDEKWNYRDVCNTGYLPKASQNTEKASSAFYSEIDIEIVKTSKYWTAYSYGKSEGFPTENAEENNNLIVSCTNWDLACKDQKDFFRGVQDITHNGNTFTLHRWSNDYKAVTLKSEYPHSKTVSDIFYYQIDWQPNKIIWRIGSDKNNMKEIGYMDNTVTNIPNNQMVPIMSQEFHYGEWWPATPFPQNFIPYPKSDLVGEIYSIEVE